MNKLTRNSRIVAITKILMENPNKIMGLNYFSNLLNAAKSTISEDLIIIRASLDRLRMGKIETITGAAGGVKYVPVIDKDKSLEFAKELCNTLSDGSRIIAGNYIYMTDIMYSPSIINKAGIILSSYFKDIDVDYVITVETKGIPLAYEVAKNLGVELVSARRSAMVTEGSTVTINYVSGTNGRLQQMSLAKKSMKPKTKSIFIDDFLKGGGTAQGIKELLMEFDCELVGIGVLVESNEVHEKLIDEYISIIEVNSVKYETLSKKCEIKMHPSKYFN